MKGSLVGAVSATDDMPPQSKSPMLSIVPAPAETSIDVAKLERDLAASDLVDEVQLATRLGVARSTLQSWRYAGRGPRYIKLGRLIRYRTTDVDAFLRANTRGKSA